MTPMNMWMAAALVAGISNATPANGQCTPEEAAQLFASDGAPSTYFGVSVAIDGDTAVVGNPDDDTIRGANAGSAYVFVRGDDGVWKEQAHLFASDGAAGDLFGIAVAISGDTVVVGACNDNTGRGADAGSAYVFVRSGDKWTQQKHLFASDGAAGDLFGISVTMSADTIVVAANSDDTSAGTDAGSAYVFEFKDDAWKETQHLFASDAAAGDTFADWLVMSQDTLVISAFHDDTAGGTDAGSAYIFVRGDGGWEEQAHLFASDGADDDNFGWSLAVSGDTVVVGAIADDTPGGTNAGSAYVFVRDGSDWAEQAHLYASDGATEDFLSTDVAISGDILLIGAARDDTLAGENAGSAYIFTRENGVWTETGRLFASDGAADDRFGYCVVMRGETALIGAWGNDTLDGKDAGSAYLFDVKCRKPGDLNCDGSVDFNDIDPFVTALISRDDYQSQYPDCNWLNADINRDASVDFNDIDGFVDCLINGGC